MCLGPRRRPTLQSILNIWGQTGLHPGPSPFLHNNRLDLHHMSSTNSITVGGKTFTYLKYMDDAAPFTQQQSDANDILISFDSSAAVFGMQIS